MKIFDILPQGEENALPGREVERILHISRRERRAQAAKELEEGFLVLYTTNAAGGYFRPSDGEKGREEIRRFREREAARARSINAKVKAVDTVLKQCDGQTELVPAGKQA